MEEINNSVPWIREINYAVSRFGHLAEEFLDEHGKDGLRAELLIKLLEVEKQEQYHSLGLSKFNADGSLDPLAIEIAKNRIHDIRNESRLSAWVLNPETGDQELATEPIEEVPLYDGAILKDGKRQQLVKYEKLGSETGSADYSNHNTIPEGEDNLEDTTLPDVAEEMDRAIARAELGRIYRQLKPAMRQALLLSRIHKHPKAEQPALLERFCLQSKLGLSDSGWDKRWSRTRNEIVRLRAQNSLTRAEGFRYFSDYKLAWFEEYRAIIMRDLLSKFAGGAELLALERESAAHGELKESVARTFEQEIVQKADEIKARHCASDPFEGRAIKWFPADCRTNYHSLRNGNSQVKTLEQIYLENLAGKLRWKHLTASAKTYGKWEAPDSFMVAVLGCRQCSGAKVATLRLTDGCTVPERLHGGGCDSADCLNPECICRARTVVNYLCRECCTPAHHRCSHLRQSTVRRFIGGKWVKVPAMVRCKARRAIDYSLCEFHLFQLPKFTTSALFPDITEWVWSDRWTNRVADNLKRKWNKTMPRPASADTLRFLGGSP